MRVNERDPLQFPLFEAPGEATGKGGGLLVGGMGDQVGVVIRRRIARPLHRLGHLAAERMHLHFPLALPCHLQGLADDIGVEAAAEGGIAGNRDDGGAAWRRGGIRREESVRSLRFLHRTALRRCRQGGEYACHQALIGTQGFDRTLRLAELGGSDELHRRSDLQRAAYGIDPVFRFPERCHSNGAL